MSLPVIAIVVASVSALFTGTNMLVSALTYRRVKPHVRMKIRWTLIGPDSTRRALEGQAAWGFDIHLKNVSPTAAKVKGLQLVTRYSQRPRRWDDPLRSDSQKFIDLIQEVPIPPEYGKVRMVERDKELPAFGGLQWDVMDDWVTIPSTPWEYLTFQITLTNGDVVRGEWHHRGRLRRFAEEMQKVFPEKLNGFPMLRAPEN
ncbi:hypothetical protein ACGFX8_09090 [Streptomyces sp. NPDC048362]|uniref:hypothetical protein n=1 Tax=Streptomyces sp. NPDC048362 TaxID=3365539 RepID=UPI00371AF114